MPRAVRLDHPTKFGWSGLLRVERGRLPSRFAGAAAGMRGGGASGVGSVRPPPWPHHGHRPSPASRSGQPGQGCVLYRTSITHLLDLVHIKITFLRRQTEIH